MQLLRRVTDDGYKASDPLDVRLVWTSNIATLLDMVVKVHGRAKCLVMADESGTRFGIIM